MKQKSMTTEIEIITIKMGAIMGILSKVAPIEFSTMNRNYKIDFVYKVVALNGENGTGKTLMFKDINENKDDIDAHGFNILCYSCYSDKRILQDIFSREKKYFKNKIIILDDVECIDAKALKSIIERTDELNTQWLQIGHCNYQCICSEDAIMKLSVKHKKDAVKGDVFDICMC